MSSCICTLFEGHYHYGLSALSNSLYQYGFRGSIYAGYKGSLPAWADKAVENLALDWSGGRTLSVDGDFHIHFLPLTTDYHLTNYKPNFMLRLWDGPAKNATSIAYFDPDIVVKVKWQFFENWMSHGVGLVHEIIANDMPPSHPLRKDWERLILTGNRKIMRHLHSYINGGFCGVHKNNIEFLHVWKEMFDLGVKNSQLTPGQWRHSYDRSYIFYAQDQDVLNIAAMCSESPISEMGPEAMDFIHGGTTMSHSAGGEKPWKKNFIQSALNGHPPNTVDKLYWTNSNSPIVCYSKAHVKSKKISLLVASFLGRFYRRY